MDTSARFEKPVIDKSIIERVRKLLALADSDRNSHEHERKVAMQAAMDLLAKHNLSLTQVDDATFNLELDEVTANFKTDPWIRTILSAACKLFYTDYYFKGTRNWQGRLERFPVFVGTPENIAVTIEMAGWFIQSVRQESNFLYTDAFERRSFRLGAARRIYARALEMMKAELDTMESSGTSLVVLRNQFESANAAHLAAKNLGKFKSRGVYLDQAAYADGKMYGDQVGLNRQVSNDIKRLPQFG